jgi:hypothetical protein
MNCFIFCMLKASTVALMQTFSSSSGMDRHIQPGWRRHSSAAPVTTSTPTTAEQVKLKTLLPRIAARAARKNTADDLRCSFTVAVRLLHWPLLLGADNEHHNESYLTDLAIQAQQKQLPCSCCHLLSLIMTVMLLLLLSSVPHLA